MRQQGRALATTMNLRQKDHDSLYWEFPGAKGWVAVRKGEWKAVKESHRDANPQVPKFCMDITYPQELLLDK